MAVFVTNALVNLETQSIITTPNLIPVDGLSKEPEISVAETFGKSPV